jgi:hypothetical protein
LETLACGDSHRADRREGVAVAWKLSGIAAPSMIGRLTSVITAATSVLFKV